MADDAELDRIRTRIDAADAALVEALDARAQAVLALAQIKERHPETYFTLPSAAEIVNASLERAVQFPPEVLARVIREVVGATANMIAPIRVSICGPHGGFGEVAARAYFGSTTRLEVAASIPRVFEEVDRQRAAFGVVPFETSSDGSVAATLDSLSRCEARICGEVTVGCSYDLASATGNAGDVEKIYGTAEAIAACARTLKREFPRATVLDVSSGSVGQDLAREDHGAATIVAGWSEHAAIGLRQVYGAVEDEDGVETRFVVVGHERPRRTGRDRTILSIAVGDEPGSLHKALQPFATRGINLTRIESRSPRGRSWRYIFFLELDGHVTDRAVLTTVEEVRAASRHLRVLGSFPRPA